LTFVCLSKDFPPSLFRGHLCLVALPFYEKFPAPPDHDISR
jgi:hypothetical protein